MINDDNKPDHVYLRENLVLHPYAWPGGYPCYAIADDGGPLCKTCCATEAEIMDNTDSDCPDDAQWHINAITVNWEDGELYCDHCHERIESAYAEPEDVMEVHNKENES
jgi:hypothetical protein